MDDNLLRRIGEAFSELTGGTHIGVTSREDDRGMVRLVLRLRDFPEEEVTSFPRAREINCSSLSTSSPSRTGAVAEINLRTWFGL